MNPGGGGGGVVGQVTDVHRKLKRIEENCNLKYQ